MASLNVEQLLHGYRRGHEQLASSIKLPARDAELITRLSDLSGSLASAPKFASYLTVYPLPSGAYFALARTWPDPDATRAGCVLTHTLLVPAPVWATLGEPRALDDLFVLPVSRSLREYGTAITIPERFASGYLELKDSDQDVLLTFVDRYFGEGRTPIVWFGQNHSEEVLWRLLRGLWPKLRSSFSACTFCLQPRSLDDRPFELMFAPPAVYPRFKKTKSEHLIYPTDKPATDRRSKKVETWCTVWAKHLFGPIVPKLPPTDPALWAELDEDPTAVRRLLLMEGIIESKNHTPQIFVGAMDLVESLAKSRDSVVALKQRVAERAVRAARETGEPTNGLESLRLIEDRLRRSSFSSTQSTVGPVMLDAVATLTRKFPEITAEYLVESSVDPELTESWFGRGLLQGIRMLAHDEPDKLLVFRNVLSIVRHLLTAEPKLSALFIHSAAAQRSDPSMRADLLSWLTDVDHELRRIFRASLVPELSSSDTDILTALLKGLQPEEVGVMLNVLWLRMNQFETTGIRDLVIGQIARGYPGETREWARSLSPWTPVVAQVFATTYPPTKQGLLELLNWDERASSGEKAETVATFIQELTPRRFPYWLTDVAHEQSSLISTLLDAGESPSSTVIQQTQRLLSEISTLPVARWPSLLQQVLGSSQRPYFATLLNLTMCSLLPAYVTGIVSESELRDFQEHEALAPWFHKVGLRDLKSLVTQGVSSSTVHWFNAWRWTATAPKAFYAREPTLLPDLIGVLLTRSHDSEWSRQISQMWSQVLCRARSQSPYQRTALVLCVQALKFSFNNSRLPLGSLVAEAFYDVYTAVNTSTFSSVTAPLFGIFDWDKCKELRRELVDRFLQSQWPPGDLALAVTEVRLLRKIFKRIMRENGGKRYIKAMLTDLERRTEQNATTLARALRGMLANPSFYEEWD